MILRSLGKLSLGCGEAGRGPLMRFGVVSIFGLSILGIAALLYFLFWLEYQDIRHRAEHSAVDFASVIASNFEQVLRRADGDVRSFLSLLRPDDFLKPVAADRRDEIDAHMTAHQATFSEIISFRVFNADGRIVFTGGPQHSDFSVTDRDWFKTLRDRPDLDTVLSEVIIAKAALRPSIIYAAAVRNTDRRFLGAIVAAIDLDPFRVLINSLDIGEQSVIAIRRSDNGHVILRRPESAETGNLSTLPMFEAVAGGQRGGVFELTSPIDGIRRIYAFTSPQNFPLYIAVGISRQDYLAPLLYQIELFAPPLTALFAVLFLLFVRENRLKQSLAGLTGQLRDSTLRHDELARRIPVGTYTLRIRTDGSMAFDYVSPRLCDLLALDGRAVLEDAGIAFAITHPNDLEGLVRTTKEAALSLLPFRWEGQLIVRSEALWFTIEADPTHLPNGDSLWNGVVSDITERKRAEMALFESEERLKLALNAATMGVWEWRIPTGGVYWTPECLAIFGVDRFGGTVEDFKRLALPEDADRVMDAARRAVETRTPFNAEFRVLRSDGEVRWLANQGRVDYDGDGKPVRMVGIVHDVTARREHEEEIKQARLVAEDATRAKSDFLAMMSHEIRTPITSVLGMVDLLHRTPLSEEQTGYLNALGSSTKTLLTVLNDILDISKLEAGKVVIDAVPFQLYDAVHSVVDLARANASTKGLNVDLAVAGEVPDTVIGDPSRLKQILFNLLSNAIKFTEDGAVRLRMSVRRRLEDSADIQIEVEDTGIGIDPGQIGKLFTAFTQADQSTTRRFGGTGLGLAITKRLVGLMGGEISVDSEPGRGTKFRFSLPFTLVSHGCTVPKAPLPGPPATPPRPLRLLLAEDNRINQMLVRAMLLKLGHTVEVVDNGRMAVAAVIAGDYDAVLMDIQMPEMGGEEATRAIRTLPPPKNRLAVLALTADVLPEHRERYLQAGVNDLLAKPIDWEALSHALEVHAGAAAEASRKG